MVSRKEKKNLWLIILVWLCAVSAPLLIRTGRCGSCEGRSERDRLGLGIVSVLGNAAATFILISMPLRGAKQSLLSHFGDAEAQLLENLPAVAGLRVNWRLGFCWCEAAC